MYYPSLKEFLKLSQKGNVIPVYKQVNADLDTPVSAFLKMKGGDYAFLFESVEGQEKIARYSFLGNNPSLVLKSKKKDMQIIRSSHNGGYKAQKFSVKKDPLQEIKKIMRDFRPAVVKGLPRFYGGFVGYIGYDMVRFFEKLPDKNPDDLKLPDAVFMLMDNLLVFDHASHTVKIIYNVIFPKKASLYSKEKKVKMYNAALSRIEYLHRDFKKNLSSTKNSNYTSKARSKVASNFSKNGFGDIVNKAKVYIKKGDIIQAVLSQRFKVKIKIGSFDIYRRLRSLNPSPYMFFLKFKDATLIGSSPEMLVRCENGIIQTRPIAGTRPRGKTEEEDTRLKKELLSDKKEKAEHIMLVDLGRNDLGRVSLKGTVKVTEFMNIEKYSHVMHLVSEVTGRLDSSYDIYDVLRACFPAGTVTGSPKIRAMEIIDELENIKRGIYAGCVGYFSFSHNLDTCITIRTIAVKGDYAYVQAGAGIVADSIAKNEYYESVNKARALIEAMG